MINSIVNILLRFCLALAPWPYWRPQRCIGLFGRCEWLASNFLLFFVFSFSFVFIHFFFLFILDCNIWKYPRTDAEDTYPELSDLKLNLLENEQIFDTDGISLKVVHTPGHTTDHCILFVNETKELFSGDCILGEGTAVFEDLYDYMKSLELIINENPTTIYPGHGNIVTVSVQTHLSNELCPLLFQIHSKYSPLFLLESDSKNPVLYWSS